MKKINDFDKIKESGNGFNRIPAGGYIARILDVLDVPEKQYLKISFDIADGEYKNFFANVYKNDDRDNKKWPAGGSFIRSYKDRALPMFKAFVTSVEKSNSGFKFDFDETKMQGKLVGLVLADEEYLSNTGKVRTRTYMSATRSVDSIKSGDFTVPNLKKLDASKISTSSSAPAFKNPFENDIHESIPDSNNQEVSWGGENPFA